MWLLIFVGDKIFSINKFKHYCYKYSVINLLNTLKFSCIDYLVNKLINTTLNSVIKRGETKYDSYKIRF